MSCRKPTFISYHKIKPPSLQDYADPTESASSSSLPCFIPQQQLFYFLYHISASRLRSLLCPKSSLSKASGKRTSNRSPLNLISGGTTPRWKDCSRTDLHYSLISLESTAPCPFSRAWAAPSRASYYPSLLPY